MKIQGKTMALTRNQIPSRKEEELKPTKVQSPNFSKRIMTMSKVSIRMMKIREILDRDNGKIIIIHMTDLTIMIRNLWLKLILACLVMVSGL